MLLDQLKSYLSRKQTGFRTVLPCQHDIEVPTVAVLHLESLREGTLKPLEAGAAGNQSSCRSLHAAEFGVSSPEPFQQGSLAQRPASTTKSRWCGRTKA